MILSGCKNLCDTRERNRIPSQEYPPLMRVHPTHTSPVQSPAPHRSQSALHHNHLDPSDLFHFSTSLLVRFTYDTRFLISFNSFYYTSLYYTHGPCTTYLYSSLASALSFISRHLMFIRHQPLSLTII